MKHDQLYDIPCRSRLSPDEALHAGIRQRLTRVRIDAGTNGNIFINIVLHSGPNDPITKDAVVVLRSHYECRQDRPANAGPDGSGDEPTGSSPTSLTSN